MNQRKRRKKRYYYATSQVFLQMLIILLVILVLVAAFLIHKTSSGGFGGVEIIGTDHTSDSDSKETVDLPDLGTITVPPAPLGPIEANPLYDGFELPISGATGYATLATEVREGPADQFEVILNLEPGDVFTILSLAGDWLQIKAGTVVGWMPSIQCLVNLPDVVPSIAYNNTNAYRSLFRASELKINGITGEKLYDAKSFNPRLNRDEFIMPVLIPAAKKLCAAQQSALKFGRTLIVYEAYRPHETQMTVAKAVKAMAQVNPTVYKGLNSGSWSISWFIATSLSNHQMGFAFDVSLGNVTEYQKETIGKYSVNRVTAYDSCQMPTEMHELSVKAINYQKPFPSSQKTGWENLPLASTMTGDARLLRYICTGAGLTPLASEWWHFNDLDTHTLVKNKHCMGNFYTSVCVSTLPD